MIGWVRENKRRTHAKTEPESKLELKAMAQERPLIDVFYPRRTTLSSCFILLDLEPNVTFALIETLLHSNTP